MGELYRTLLGHFRHEIAHYYWNRLVSARPALDDFRQLFGDEQQDYGAALQRYYASGPPSDRPEHFVSAYATAHPWEDFAETWAQSRIHAHAGRTNPPNGSIRAMIAGLRQRAGLSTAG
jgi:hypothetical protein